MDAREKAVERLAEWLIRAGVIGERSGEYGDTWDAAVEQAMDADSIHAMTRYTDAKLERWRELAKNVVHELGLIAVDPELVNAVEKADADLAAFRAEVEAKDGRPFTDYDDMFETDGSRVRLANAVLSQLRR